MDAGECSIDRLLGIGAAEFVEFFGAEKNPK